MAEEKLKLNLAAESSNLDCIETDLWLGNLAAATDIKILEEKKIKFIFTVNSFPLPKEIVDLSFITTKYIKAYDTPRDDLLSYFEEAYEFIEHARKRGAILVHCFHGVSRSATITLSYLMKKKNMTVKAALSHVKSKRKNVEPNPGFLEQLKLYEIMHWTIDKNNMQYKMFRLYVAIDHVKKENVVPQCCADVIKPDPLLSTPNANSIVYRCKKCRRIVAQGSNLIPHVAKEKYSWRDRRWSECLEKTKICRLTYFIEPLAWMENISIFPEGKLHCPNTICKNKLGSYSWVTGSQCPCGTQVCPGFYLIPSKVDKHPLDKMSMSITFFNVLANRDDLVEKVLDGQVEEEKTEAIGFIGKSPASKVVKVEGESKKWAGYIPKRLLMRFCESGTGIRNQY